MGQAPWLPQRGSQSGGGETPSLRRSSPRHCERAGGLVKQVLGETGFWEGFLEGETGELGL